MTDYEQESLSLHEKNGGKMEIAATVPLTKQADLSRAYTPGVAAVSRAIGKDKELAYKYTIKKNTIAVVTDGSAILGLGNLGPEAALPVMEGKAILFKEFADINAFPICLSTQDPEEIIATVKAIAPGFGGINLEDIAAPNCFIVERRLQEELDIPVMHDDQHGTATVVLAGLINALKLRGLSKEKAKVVIIGAGSAGTAIMKILLAYGLKDIIVYDSQGAIYANRPNLTQAKAEIAELTNPAQITGPLAEGIKDAHVFIGVSKPGLLSKEMVASMAEQPIIFALANPTPEIMPNEAISAGAFMVATGRSDFPNQVNNLLAFPGIFRGALDNRIKQFTEKHFLAAATALAGYLPRPTQDQILPSPLDKGIVEAIKKVIT
ncbi:MAG: NAD-dependent malic enzyme [Candidatus Harrisonbacteria bacterium CG10_big_fil_rev_8_21_14_0_10_49_15]|uniref:NAD-dependent malic enzyme n=1 Tax=Candidatus Harrisonbacteria bacterium CG10_big_fil_rev_8_21_14_0_10_49_15 TaxID=1974587 RepID=A0A2H0UKN9_9BACT|nr:MAG: NAD-dependent malic enzyme [Candidatus Harrisonbacteria bacterium CG10_big_fil_rev_8_21_14_0_10_49_15]